MLGDNTSVYMACACFYIGCSDCVEICGNICCVAGDVEDSVFFSFGVLKYVCVGDVVDVVFSV